MPAISLSTPLRKSYEDLFDTCQIRPDRFPTLDRTVARLLANRARYEAVSATAGVPWYFVAVIHNLEADMNFTRHLHNGDPLSARTVQVPAGRPRRGQPPFTWEESAADALALKGLDAQTDWTLAGTLYQLERYNGWGYRRHHPDVLSPYLWSFSDHYTCGKYVADGRWSETAISRQCGAAVLLRRLAELGEIRFPDKPAPEPVAPALVAHSIRKSRDPATVRRVEDLQRWLNTFAGIYVRVDGIPGNRTSDAYRKITGSYLPGDPRGS